MQTTERINKAKSCFSKTSTKIITFNYANYYNLIIMLISKFLAKLFKKKERKCKLPISGREGFHCDFTN